MTAPRSVHILIHGRVQGVGFRYWAQGQAFRLGLKGWVRNRGRDKVELVVYGSEDRVKEMLASCTLGPPGARVDQVEVVGEGVEAHQSFEILPSV